MTENTIKKQKSIYEIKVHRVASRDIKDILKEILIEESKKHFEEENRNRQIF